MRERRTGLLWKRHHDHLLTFFNRLLNTRFLADVTIIAEGNEIKAHKLVLSACSSYFLKLFSMNPTDRHTMPKKVKYDDLTLIINLMYSGEINVAEEKIPRLRKLARLFDIHGLNGKKSPLSPTKSNNTPKKPPLIKTIRFSPSIYAGELSNQTQLRNKKRPRTNGKNDKAEQPQEEINKNLIKTSNNNNNRPKSSNAVPSNESTSQGIVTETPNTTEHNQIIPRPSKTKETKKSNSKSENFQKVPKIVKKETRRKASIKSQKNLINLFSDNKRPGTAKQKVRTSKRIKNKLNNEREKKIQTAVKF